MNTETFWRHWKQCFDGALPLGYSLRSECGDRWVRIHSLPRAKRYPSTESELHELLDRQNRAATHMFGRESTIVMIEFVLDAVEGPRVETDPAVSIGAMPVRVGRLTASESFMDEELVVTVREIVWRSHELDDSLRQVAEDEGRFVLADLSKAVAFAPYDGGVDLIFDSPSSAAISRSLYKSWLSEREDGL